MNYKDRGNVIKDLVDILAEADTGKVNPFVLLKLQMSIADKIKPITNINDSTTDKEILERQKSLAKILDIVTEEANKYEEKR